MKAMFLARVAESKHMYSVALFRTVSLARTQETNQINAVFINTDANSELRFRYQETLVGKVENKLRES